MPGLVLIKKKTKMVSERKKDNKKVKCCSQILETDFCPHCGTPKPKISIYPQRFIIGFHASAIEVMEHDDICQDITLEYEITEKNGDPNIILLSDGTDKFRLVKFGSVGEDF